MPSVLLALLVAQSLVRPCSKPDAGAIWLGVGTQKVRSGVHSARWLPTAPFEVVPLGSDQILVIGAQAGHGTLSLVQTDRGTHRTHVQVLPVGPDLFVSDVWRLGPCSDELTWDWPRGDEIGFVIRGAPENEKVMHGLRRVSRIWPERVSLRPPPQVPFFERALSDANRLLWSSGFTGARWVLADGGLTLTRSSPRMPPKAAAAHVERDLRESVSLLPDPPRSAAPASGLARDCPPASGTALTLEEHGSTRIFTPARGTVTSSAPSIVEAKGRAGAFVFEAKRRGTATVSWEQLDGGTGGHQVWVLPGETSPQHRLGALLKMGSELVCLLFPVDAMLQLEARDSGLAFVGEAHSREEWAAAQDVVELTHGAVTLEATPKFVELEVAADNAWLADLGLWLAVDGGVVTAGGRGRALPFAQHLADHLNARSQRARAP